MPIFNTVLGGGTTPTGTISITTNGTHDVSNYANADVQVSGGGPVVYIPRALSTSGSDIVYGAKGIIETNVSTQAATIVDKYAFAYAFYNSEATGQQQPSISMPNVVEVKERAFYYALYQAADYVGGTTPLFSAPNLTTVGNYAFNYAFGEYSQFTTFDFSHVTSVGSYAFQYAFGKKTVSVDFSGLTALNSGSYCFNNALKSCTALTTFNFNNLTIINGITSAFGSCLSWAASDVHTGDLNVSFPALTSINGNNSFQSFASYNKNIRSLSFPSLTSINSAASCFSTALLFARYPTTTSASISFPSLKKITGSGSCFGNLFGSDNSGYGNATASVDFSALEEITTSPGCFSNAFTKTNVADSDSVINLFPKLRYIYTSGNYDAGVFNFAFNMSYNATKAIFPSLQMVESNSTSNSNYHFYQTFVNDSSLRTVEFPKIKILKKAINILGSSVDNVIFGEDISLIKEGGIYTLFINKSNIDLTIPVVTTSGDSAIRSLGVSDSIVRFPVFYKVINESTSYSLAYMLSGSSNVTVHFPIAKQSLIENLYGYPNFGGSNITVLFDLVYTVNDGTITYTRFHDGYNETSMGYWADYFVGSDGETYYRAPETYSTKTINGDTYYMYAWRKSTTSIGNYDRITIAKDPEVGDEAYDGSSAQQVTVASYVKRRVYVPISAEPAVGDTLYSNEECTTVAGTITTIA